MTILNIIGGSLILAIFCLWIAANFALVLFIHACACANQEQCKCDGRAEGLGVRNGSDFIHIGGDTQ